MWMAAVSHLMPHPALPSHPTLPNLRLSDHQQWMDPIHHLMVPNQHPTLLWMMRVVVLMMMMMILMMMMMMMMMMVMWVGMVVEMRLKVVAVEVLQVVGCCMVVSMVVVSMVAKHWSMAFDRWMVQQVSSGVALLHCVGLLHHHRLHCLAEPDVDVHEHHLGWCGEAHTDHGSCRHWQVQQVLYVPDCENLLYE